MTTRRRRLDRRTFTVEDQQRFARATGDHNPVHLDPLVARRTMVGRPVVHGMHLVLWALDRWAGRPSPADPGGATAVTRIEATFAKPAFVGEALTLNLLEDDADRARLEVSAHDAVLLQLAIAFATGTGSPPPFTAEAPADFGAPKERDAAAFEGSSGEVPIEADLALLTEDMRAVTPLLGGGAVAVLGALSRLVGMECPGLHSLFSSLDVELDRPAPVTARLTWRVTRADPRVGAVDMDVDAGALRGHVRSFARPAPSAQPGWEELAGLVVPGEFEGQRALVVGGSRGLGEVTAGLVAAGGGHPAVTYLRGQDDAEAVATRLRDHGASCETVHLDVRNPGPALRDLRRRGWTPTHVYYFATPRIFVRKAELFETRLFREFTAAYVDGFVATWRACRAVTSSDLRVLYPSTVAVDEPVRALTEYTAAKAAGEEVARQLDRFDPRTAVLVVRLPRIVTDQTATLLGAPAADPAVTLLGAVRELAGRQMSGRARSGP